MVLRRLCRRTQPRVTRQRLHVRVSSRFYVVADEVRGCDRVRSARKADDCDASESPG